MILKQGTELQEYIAESPDNDEEPHVWIEIGNISLYIKKTDEGVVVDFYATECEGLGLSPFTSTYGFFDEAREIRIENKKEEG